jgi:hypothetical protein
MRLVHIFEMRSGKMECALNAVAAPCQVGVPPRGTPGAWVDASGEPGNVMVFASGRTDLASGLTSVGSRSKYMPFAFKMIGRELGRR